MPRRRHPGNRGPALTGSSLGRFRDRSFDKFGFPLLSRVAVVQRNPDGLPMATQVRAVARARAVSEGQYPDVKPIVAAAPVMNTLGLFPGSREDGTTIVTMLFTAPDVSLADQVEAARQFVANHYDADDAVVGVTGSVPAGWSRGGPSCRTCPGWSS